MTIAVHIIPMGPPTKIPKINAIAVLILYLLKFIDTHLFKLIQIDPALFIEQWIYLIVIHSKYHGSINQLDLFKYFFFFYCVLHLNYLLHSILDTAHIQDNSLFLF